MYIPQTVPFMENRSGSTVQILMNQLFCALYVTPFPVLLLLSNTHGHKRESQDTSCTALWVAVSGDWESLSS